VEKGDTSSGSKKSPVLSLKSSRTFPSGHPIHYRSSQRYFIWAAGRTLTRKNSVNTYMVVVSSSPKSTMRNLAKMERLSHPGQASGDDM